MKKIITLLVIATVSIYASDTKLYDVKSGKIDYVIKGSGNLMGMSMKSVGKKRVIFNDYGAKTLTEENKITKQQGMGQNTTEKSHTINYIKNGIVYEVDFDKKRIIRLGDISVMMSMMGGGNSNISQMSKDMLIKMGGKKVGKDNVLGYDCEVWDLMGVKQCIYKGVTLKIQTNIMGINQTEIATKAEFDIDIDDSSFKLPDFDVYDKMGRKLDKSILDSMDKASTQASNQAIDKMQQAGIQPGMQMTPEQQTQMMDAMLPMMKQQMIQEENNLLGARECIKKASSLGDVKMCIKAMGDDVSDADLPPTWDETTKQQTLQEIDNALNSIKCVKNASNMQEAQSCMQ